MRGVFVLVVFTWQMLQLGVQLLVRLITRRGPSPSTLFGHAIANCGERLGGAFLKMAQLMSTRVDLLPADTIKSLSRLQDNVRPLRFESVEQMLGNGFLAKDKFHSIDRIPIATATIAQVHRASLATGEIRDVVLKVKRPGIEQLLKKDVAYIKVGARLLSWLSAFRKIPIREATEVICYAFANQADFVREAESFRRFYELFRDFPGAQIPRLVDELCTPDVIVMEYLANYRKIPEIPPGSKVGRTAVENGLRALYEMIFKAGLIHCDLHPGNILCDAKGNVAILDMGFIAHFSPETRCAFSEFFASIPFRNGKAAARTVRQTALSVPINFDPVAFEKDMQELVNDTAGRKAGEFQVAKFVFKLFKIQKIHGIYGSPNFTLAILSLLAYEGLIKNTFPKVDFQREAVPFVISSLTSFGLNRSVGKYTG